MKSSALLFDKPKIATAAEVLEEVEGIMLMGLVLALTNSSLESSIDSRPCVCVGLGIVGVLSVLRTPVRILENMLYKLR
jgi:hypothetical protein